MCCKQLLFVVDDTLEFSDTLREFLTVFDVDISVESFCDEVLSSTL